MTASRSETSSAAEASSRLRASSSMGRPAKSLVDQAWLEKDFIPTVQQRGAAVIKARGASSAASAASAAVDHLRD